MKDKPQPVVVGGRSSWSESYSHWSLHSNAHTTTPWRWDCRVHDTCKNRIRGINLRC